MTRREVLQSAVAALTVCPSLLGEPAVTARRLAARRDGEPRVASAPLAPSAPLRFVDHGGWIIPAGDRDALIASAPGPRSKSS